jgi:uncharacterized sulfatase
MLLLVTLAATSNAEEKKLNILFAFADDWGKYASAYAPLDKAPTPNSLIRTPNFDRIAAEGVLFTNAHVNSPSCTPCRSALLSGQYFFRTGMGAILTGAKWDLKIPSFPLLLRDQGAYHIGQTYKVWSPGTPVDAPFGERAHEYEKSGSKFNGFSQNVTKGVNDGLSIDDAKQVLYDEVLGNFESFVADRESKDLPFCYWFGPTNVHRKWIKGSGKALWGLDPDKLEGKLPAFLPDVPDVREDVADYLGEAMGFDTALGLLIKRLEEIGELDNTIIVVSGDHGPPGFSNGKTNLYTYGTAVPLAIRWPGKGKPGRVVTDFVNLMDLAPTFCEAGGVTPPEVMTGRSLVPVLDSDKDGRVDPKRDHVVTGRERHVHDTREGMLPYPQRAIRTDDFLYIRNFKPDRWPMGTPTGITDDGAPSIDELANNTRVTLSDMDAGPTKAWIVRHRNDTDADGKHYYDIAFAKRPEEELYDLRNDPDEVKNVASDPAHAERKQALSEWMMAILKDAKDPRVLGDGSTFDKPPYTNIPEKFRKKK